MWLMAVTVSVLSLSSSSTSIAPSVLVGSSMATHSDVSRW
jgi:hypothetical protein